MSGMKDSGAKWLGEIPAEWSMNRLRYLASFESGATPSKDDLSFWDGDIPWVSSMEVKTDVLEDTSLHITEAAVRSCSTQVEPPGTVVMVVRSGILQHTIPVALLGREMTINQDIKALHFDGRMLPKYFFYLVKGSNDNLLKELMKDKSTVDNISLEYLKSMNVPVPPIFEQQQIVTYLDNCSARTSKVETILNNQILTLESYKRSIIHEAVTKGLDYNAPMKDSGIKWIGDMPVDWVVKRFKYVAAVAANLVDPDDYTDYIEIDPDNIEKGSGRLLDVITAGEVGAISAKQLFHKGQILYSKIRPELNKVAIAPDDGVCSADMYPIDTWMNPLWLLYVMRSDLFVKQVGLRSSLRVKMPKVNADELANIVIPVPPMDVQQSIADYLDTKRAAIDKTISIKCEQLKTLRRERQSLIYEYVTGKRRVSEEE